MLDNYILETCFEDLLNVFSGKNASAFSSCLFSVDTNNTESVNSFEKLIYNKGSQEEIYTKKERLIIDNVSQFNVCSTFYMYERHQRVLCRIIAIDLTNSNSPIYDSIATMKICNKALDSFNIYILVTAKHAHIGCDLLEEKSKTSCLISTPINHKINWESLLYVFLEINDNDGFLKYYYSVTDAIASIYTCYDHKEISNDMAFCYQSDDYEEHWYDPSDNSLYCNISEEIDEIYDLFDSFEKEVENIKKELDFIKSNRVNSLEMLFEAEKQIIQDDNDYPTNDVSNADEDIYSEKLHSLLSNPDELIKALKNRK